MRLADNVIWACVEKAFAIRCEKIPQTVILECGRCTGILLAAKTQKTHTCPYCGIRIDLQKAKRLACSENAFVASEMLRKIKAERQNNARKNSGKKQAS